MKIKHVLLAFVFLLIAEALNENLYISLSLASAINDIIERLLAVCLILLAYLTIRNIYRAIKSIATKDYAKSQKSRKLQNIDRALDEIEFTLNTMTEAGQENGNITPIWSTTPKDRK